MTVQKDSTVLVPTTARNKLAIAGLILGATVGFTLGTSYGVHQGENREHSRICNSPQPPFVAPVAIPACQ